jgi:nitroimidazol reductase NimA-like FMN-containing flavoprotein (pyridoxamine 5'-phosphate oxidase superfamily)
VEAGDRLLLVRCEQITGQRVVSGPAMPVVTLPASADAPLVTRRSLGADEAVSLLHRGGERVGRLVITVAGEPLVYPLNFAVDGDAVVFRTRVGTKLNGITRSLATFEVDHVDASGQGWSVTFEGLAQEILDADPAELRARLDDLSLDTWPGGDRPNVVRITPYAVRGTSWVPVTKGAAVASEPGSAAF